MKAGDRLSLEEIRAFLEASDGVGFKGRHREEVYDWVYQTLRQVRYRDLKRSAGIGASLRIEDDGIEPGAKYAPAEFIPER